MMDSELMHADFCIDTEEFFGNERKQLTTNRKCRPPLQIRKTVCIHAPIVNPLIKLVGAHQREIEGL
jgi:hypothetical protein